jgi:hypothetical protein
LPRLLCVGGIIFFSWFSKELNNDLSKNNYLHGVILILLVGESICVGWGFSFPIVLVARYKLSLCHTPIKTWFTWLSGNWFLYMWVAWPRDHEVHQPISNTKPNTYYKESKAEPEPYQLLISITFPNFNINLRISNSLIAKVP